METFGLLFIAPLWGIVSTQLFFESLIEFGNIFLYLAGLFKRRVPAKDNLFEMIMSIGSVVLYVVLIAMGFWLLAVQLHYEWSQADRWVYALFCLFSAFYAAPRMSDKWRKTWREATEPHALEQRRSHLEHEKEV